MPAPKLKVTTNRKIACRRAPCEARIWNANALPRAAGARRCQTPPAALTSAISEKIPAGRLLDRRHERRRAASFALVLCETIPF
jgi:hypothetical protein